MSNSSYLGSGDKQKPAKVTISGFRFVIGVLLRKEFFDKIQGNKRFAENYSNLSPSKLQFPRILKSKISFSLWSILLISESGIRVDHQRPLEVVTWKIVLRMEYIVNSITVALLCDFLSWRPC